MLLHDYTIFKKQISDEIVKKKLGQCKEHLFSYLYNYFYCLLNQEITDN